ncbi:A24 family peptidase [Aureimonas psammosilenae]|uniref:A24 family peptidase n=1 Tax=Aureimonas psammosilenae TaxID=2495496 RepID=UPI001260A94B|nr:prepilin peptidase [Aureimonas psammosilenae]
MTLLMATLALIFPLAMVLAALSDVLSMTIPNRLPACLVLAFVGSAAVGGMDLASVGSHSFVCATALLLTFGCFVAGWMGGGDAKLIAATALWFGPTPHLLDYLFNAALFGGFLTLGLLAARAVVAPTTGVAFLDRLLGRETGVPYAVALGPAGLVAFASSPWANAAGAFFG